MSTGQPSSDRPSSRRSRRIRLSFVVIVLVVLALAGLLASFTFLGHGSGSGGLGSIVHSTTLGTSTLRITSSVGGTSVTSTRAVSTAPVVRIVVPVVVGLAQGAATARIEALGLHAQARTLSSVRPAGLVLHQNPAGGVQLSRGALVGLTVSTGPRSGIVPLVVGLAAADAAAGMRKAGLGARMRGVASDRRAGLVVAQSPGAGSHALHGIALLSVSKGPPHLRVPNVTGSQRATAVGRLHLIGFGTVVRVIASQKTPGTVLQQIPPGGSSAPRGATVHLSVAEGNDVPLPPAKVTVPDVVRLGQASAVRRLRSVGLVARVLRTHSLLAVGSVVAQSPAGGARTARGTQVSISISTGPGP